MVLMDIVPVHCKSHTKHMNILSICLSLYGFIALCWALADFSVFDLYTVGTTPWMGDQPVAKPLPIHRHPDRFEPTIPAFERAKTVHALDRAAILLGCSHFFLGPVECLIHSYSSTTDPPNDLLPGYFKTEFIASPLKGVSFKLQAVRIL
jgi:hypothetical protein